MEKERRERVREKSLSSKSYYRKEGQKKQEKKQDITDETPRRKENVEKIFEKYINICTIYK